MISRVERRGGRDSPTLDQATSNLNDRPDPVPVPSGEDAVSGPPHGDDAVTVAELAEQLRATRAELTLLRRQIEMLQHAGGSWLAYWAFTVFSTHRLVLTPHYAPRPIHIPEWYYRTPEAAALPSIALVTPSYNQGAFLERTLRSVVDQAYPRLEYIVQDGGSTDGSVATLRRYADQLTHWQSVRDRGQAAAVNSGFRHTTGEIMAYLNSDDLFLPGALHYVGDYFARHPDVDVIYGHRVLINEEDGEIGRWVLPAHDDDVLRWADFIPQETLFWRRRMWERIGAGVDETFRFALDWDLLLRLRAAGARFVRLPRFLGAFRLHPEQKTTAQAAAGEEEVARIRRRCHGRTVFAGEIRAAVRRYLFRQVIVRHLYRLGVLSY